MLHRLKSLFRSLTGRKQLEDGMDDELRFHIDAYEQDLIQSGISPDEARQRAKREFGGIERMKEECREAKGLFIPDELFRNIRQTFRSLLKSPAYFLTCVVVLALGIGANTAIFSIINSVILTPLPYQDSEKLVFLWEKFPKMAEPLGSRMQVSRKMFRDWKESTTSFTDMAAFHEERMTESGIDHPQHISVASATENFLTLLGFHPALGSSFSLEDERTAAPVAIITDQYFEKRFHRNPDALNQAITLNGTSYSVIGVLPSNFYLPAMWEGMDQKKPEVWIPVSRRWRSPERDTTQELFVIAKLQPTASLESARAEMKTVAARIRDEEPDRKTFGWEISVFPISVEDRSPELHQSLYILLAATGLLLLIACVNLTNLTLARASERVREVAVRLALGASRARVIGYLMTESLMISAVGALLGLVLAFWIVQGILALKLDEFSRPELITLNFPVFIFAAVVSILTTFLVGLIPAINASRIELHSAMKSGKGGGGSTRNSRKRQVLISVEVALALMLVSGAVLMIRSFQELIRTGVGFSLENLVAGDIDLPASRYKNGADQSRFFRSLMEQSRANSSVIDVSIVNHLPLHSVAATNFFITGKPDFSEDNPYIADYAQVSPNYLQMLNLQLIQGRMFTEQDLITQEKGTNGVAIVNEEWVRKFLPGETAPGKQLQSQDRKRAFEIIGVISNYRPIGVEHGARPQIFYPDLRIPRASLVLKTRGTESVLTIIQSIVHRVDQGIAVSGVKTLKEYLRSFNAFREFGTLLMTAFAGTALLLAMIGVYGVLTNMVSARTKEIGIRIAVGASSGNIAGMIFQQSMIPITIGIVIGLAGSFALGQFMQSLLYQVNANEIATRLLSAGAIILAAPAAIYIPLRRALGISCMEALREE